jgi:hypothetical protein
MASFGTFLSNYFSSMQALLTTPAEAGAISVEIPIVSTASTALATTASTATSLASTAEATSLASTATATPTAVQLDLVKINKKLINNGEAPLIAINGARNCVICNGKSDVVEWSLMVPCSHIICSDCTRVHKSPHIMKCPYCFKIGRSYRIRKSNYDVNRKSWQTSQCLYSPTQWSNLTIFPFGKSPNWIFNMKNVKLSLPPITNTASPTIHSDICNIQAHYAIDGELGLVRIVHNDNTTMDSSPPIDLVILLDVSGSMQRHFTNMCQMTNDVIDILSPSDRFSLITFSSSTSQPFALQPMTTNIKAVVKDLVKPDLTWGESTNLQAGIRHAIEVIKDGQITGRTMHFLLVTDGQADLGQEGHVEFQELLKISLVSTRLCTFGQNIRAEILTEALGSKIGDYVHLAGPDEFGALIKTIGVNRQQVVADQLELSINETTCKLVQIRTGDTIEYPFKVPTNSDTNIRLCYVNQQNQRIDQMVPLDSSLGALIPYIHRKLTMLETLGRLLKRIQNLSINNLHLSDCKFHLQQIQLTFKSTDYGHYTAEIATLIKSMEDNINLAECNYHAFSSDKTHSNTSTALYHTTSAPNSGFKR